MPLVEKPNIEGEKKRSVHTTHGRPRKLISGFVTREVIEMDFMAYILITMPLTVIASYIVKTLSIRKIPNTKIVQNWAVKLVTFAGGVENFHDLVLSLAAKPGYELRMLTSTSAYITESYIKWKRGGLCYYITLDEQRMLIELHYKNLIYSDAHVSEALNAILAHFQGQGA